MEHMGQQVLEHKTSRLSKYTTERTEFQVGFPTVNLYAMHIYLLHWLNFP